MRRASTLANVALLLAAAPLLLTSSTSSANGSTQHKRESAPPSVPYGVWDVTQVLVDLQDRLHWGHPPNDPVRLGRTLTISRLGVEASFPKLNCRQKVWRSRVTTWGSLLAKGFPRPPDGGRSPKPVPSDFELPVAPATTAILWTLCPGGRGTYLQEAWIVPLQDGRLVLRIDTQGLLMLTRRAPNQKPQPAFDCAKAVSPTERTICSDIELAALDRSVAVAYELAEGRVSDPDTLLESQREWLRDRDACGEDKKCLHGQMFGRVTSLMYQP